MSHFVRALHVRFVCVPPHERAVLPALPLTSEQLFFVGFAQASLLLCSDWSGLS